MNKPLTKKQRDLMVERCVRDWVVSACNDSAVDRVESLARDGFVGFKNMPDDVLRQQYENAGLDEEYDYDL